MWIPRLAIKLFLLYAALNLPMAIGYVVVVAGWQRQIITEQMENQLLRTAAVLLSHLGPQLDSRQAEQAGTEGPREETRKPEIPPADGRQAQLQREDRQTLQREVQKLSSEVGLRITVVDARGEVRADSSEDPLLMENHASRSEVAEALAGGIGKSWRYSRTVQERMLYVALPRQRGGRVQAVVRVAMPLRDIDRQVALLHSYLWVTAAFVGLLALGLTLFSAGRLLRPLADLTGAAEAIAAGNYRQPIPRTGSDELATLGRAVEHMRRELLNRLEELENNSRLLEMVLSSMGEGVLAVDARQRVLFANESSRRLLGIDTPQLVGRPLLEVTRERVVRDAAAGALSSPGPCEQDFETRGGNRRTLALRSTRLPGTPCPGVLLVLYDITALRRLESLRRDFVANVSHELKTPLASIKAYAETLRLGAIDDREHNLHFVQRIEEQADRLHRLILDLLHLARVESGKESFDVQKLAVNDLVAGCEASYRERAEAQQLQLELQIPDHPVWVRADDDGLITILDNLFTNALQYTAPGGWVTIRVRDDGSWAVLEVEDTGVGIAPAEQQRVFERFYRVDKARSRDLGGTGLGLAIVKHLAQAFGGEVGLISQPGVGSTFQIRLPRLPDT